MGRSYRKIRNTMVAALDKILSRRRVHAFPLRIHIEVNDYCNLHCPYCPRENPDIPKNTGNIPLETIQKLQPWIREAAYVGLAGNGEPFLHPRILDILRLITEMGTVPSVITNGTRLQGAILEALPKLGPMLLMVSMDGGRKETFERWRRGANFDEVVDNLKALHEAKKRIGSPHPVVNFIVCLMKENIDETEEIVDLASETGAAVIVFQTIFPYVKGMDSLRITDLGQIEQAVEKARRRAASRGIRIDYYPMSFDIDYREGSIDDPTVKSVARLVNHEEKSDRLDRLGQLDQSDRSDRTDQLDRSDQLDRLDRSDRTDRSDLSHPSEKAVYHCENIWQQLHVTLNGDVRYCCFWTGKPVGNVLRDRLEDLWNGPGWDELRGALRRGIKPPPCQGCHNLTRFSTLLIARGAWNELRDLWKQK